MSYYRNRCKGGATTIAHITGYAAILATLGGGLYTNNTTPTPSVPTPSVPTPSATLEVVATPSVPTTSATTPTPTPTPVPLTPELSVKIAEAEADMIKAEVALLHAAEVYRGLKYGN